jgi:hypothetical protein
MSENPAGIGTVAQKLVLGRAEELAIIDGAWLHPVKEPLVKAGIGGAEHDQRLPAARAVARADSRLV